MLSVDCSVFFAILLAEGKNKDYINCVRHHSESHSHLQALMHRRCSLNTFWRIKNAFCLEDKPSEANWVRTYDAKTFLYIHAEKIDVKRVWIGISEFHVLYNLLRSFRFISFGFHWVFTVHEHLKPPERHPKKFTENLMRLCMKYVLSSKIHAPKGFHITSLYRIQGTQRRLFMFLFWKEDES